MPLLVIGTGRCGTGYTAKLLSEAGADIGHERMGKDGTTDWHQTFRSHGPEWRIVQQVRSPVPTISSLQAVSPASIALVNTHVPLTEKPLERCMLWYVGVNLIAEEKALFTYQVEKVAEVWDRLCEFAGIPGRAMPANVPTTVNTRRLSYKLATWEDLDDCDADLADRVRELGKRYGYEV